MKIKPNTLCPCGSQIKYKKCCMLKKSNDHKLESERKYWSKTYSRLLSKILDKVNDDWGHEYKNEAWTDFCGAGEETEGLLELPDYDHELLQVFTSWMLYDWETWFETYEDDEGFASTPAEYFLDVTTQHLSKDERLYFEACRKSTFSFYQIKGAKPSQSIHVKDLFTGENLIVIEKLGSESVKEEQVLFAKVVTVKGHTCFDSMAPFAFPAHFAVQVIDLKSKMLKDFRFKKFETQNLKKLQPIIAPYFFQLMELLMNPQPPILTNTDGDLFEEQTLIFEVFSAQEAFEKLHPLCIAESKTELLETAQLNTQGGVEGIDFPWLKKGNKQNPEWDNTVYGHISIKRKVLNLKVNSDERAKEFLTKIKALNIKGLKLVQTVKGENSPDKPFGLKSQDKLPIELQKETEEMKGLMLKKHWEAWPYKKIPALDMKTPEEAVQTDIGKEKVEALLTSFEAESFFDENSEIKKASIKKIRNQLGFNSKYQ